MGSDAKRCDAMRARRAVTDKQQRQVKGYRARMGAWVRALRLRLRRQVKLTESTSKPNKQSAGAKTCETPTTLGFGLLFPAVSRVYGMTRGERGLGRYATGHVLYCTVRSYTVSYRVTLCHTVSYCVVLCHTVLYCVTLHVPPVRNETHT